MGTSTSPEVTGIMSKPLPAICPACNTWLDRGYCPKCNCRIERILACRKCLGNRLPTIGKECDRCNGTGLDPHPELYGQPQIWTCGCKRKHDEVISA
jgi:hypothetical protein